MLRNQEERELDRTFGKIENWSEFLTRWNTIDTEQEAVGLLYAGTTVFPFNLGDAYNHEERRAEIEQRVNFYLRVADYKNCLAVATTAQQLVVKAWLKQLRIWSLSCPSYFAAHMEVLKFLRDPRDSITKPPYPRFISEYLLPIHEEWRHGSHPDYQRGAAFNALQNCTELIVRVLCSWGLAYVLAIDGRRVETVRLIESFLKEKNYDPGKILMELSGYGDPPSSLSSDREKEAACRKAAEAYLKLTYWVGPGVDLKFDRTLRRLH